MNLAAINSFGKEWDFQHNQRMEKFIAVLISHRGETEIEVIINAGGQLLKYENIGDCLYELLLDVFSGKPNINRVKTTLKKLTSNVKIYDYIIEIRNIISGNDIFGSSAISSLMELSGVILQAYNLGRLEGIVSKSKEVIVSESLDALDLGLLVVLEINSRKALTKRLVNYTALYETDVKRYLKYLRKKDHSKILEQVKTLNDADLVVLANNVGASAAYSYTNNLFNEVDEHFFPTYDFLQTSHWEREETSEATSSAIIYFKLLVGSILDKDIIKHRKFYVREKGVRIVFVKPVDNVISIELREVHLDNKFDEHYLNFFYTLSSGETRMFYLSMKDISRSETALLYEKDVSVSLMVLAWLGVIGDTTVNLKQLTDIVNAVEGAEASSYKLSGWKRDLDKLIGQAVEGMDKDNFYYETPTQWNYSSNNSESNITRETKLRTRLIKVGRYSRKLPAGQQPSEEAKALAKKVYIELKEGYTLVDEFERLQRFK